MTHSRTLLQPYYHHPRNLRAGDRALKFGREAMDGEGGLAEMQHSLAMAQEGLCSLADVEKTLETLTAQASAEAGPLVCRRAFHCVIHAAELDAAAGHPACLQRAFHVVQEMERIGCWPDASTYDALLRVFLRAAEIGCARVREAEQALRHMTTTMHIPYPAAGGYEHATAMVGSISFPEFHGPVGVARVAIKWRESHVTTLMQIAAYQIARRDAGMADVDEVISLFGVHHLGPTSEAMDAAALALQFAVSKGVASVRDIECRWAIMDWFAYLSARGGKGAARWAA